MKKLLLLLATFVIGCDNIPEAYQGKFVSADGTLQVIVSSGSVDIIPTAKLSSVYTGDSVFSSLSDGSPGIYIAPSLYFTMMGKTVHIPTNPRMGWPAPLPMGQTESEDKFDVYMVTKMVRQETDIPVPSMNYNIYDAEVFYFQADKNQREQVNEITLQHWPESVVAAYEITYGPLGFAKTWQISGATKVEIKLIRQ